MRLLADDLRVERAVDDDGLCGPGPVSSLVEEVAAARKLGAHLVVNFRCPALSRTARRRRSCRCQTSWNG